MRWYECFIAAHIAFAACMCVTIAIYYNIWPLHCVAGFLATANYFVGRIFGGINDES